MTMHPHVNLDRIRLDRGEHPNPEHGLCLLEAVAFFAGEPHSDHPRCVSRVLGAFGRPLNDLLPDDKRQQLVPFIPKLVGTAADDLDEARSFMALDWLIRTYTPAWLELGGLIAQAQQLRELPRITGLAVAQDAHSVVRQVRDTAVRSPGATWSLPGATLTPGAVIWVAVSAAVRNCPRYSIRSAWAATQDAAQAAWNIAWDAKSAQSAIIDQLQESAITLFGDMIHPQV